MIRKSEYFEQTDQYINSEMTQPELREFEIRLEIDSDLADELNLHLDVEQAIDEADVISLRNNLNQIVQNRNDLVYNQNIGVINSFSFGLSDEFSSHKNLNSRITTEDIFNFGHSFPKIHLYQHNVAGKENIHQFYKEQFNSNTVNDSESGFSQFDEEIFMDVQNALEENEILDIRANLAQIAASMPAHQYSVQDLEDFIANRMEPELKARFEEELTVNSKLSSDVVLAREIDQAGAEADIMDLRAALNKIQKSEVHFAAKIEELESYLNQELSGDKLASFEEQLISNQELKDEINLIKNIDLALKESDVMNLRSKLRDIAGDIASQKQTERAFPARIKSGRVVISTIAAAIILLLGITGLLSKQMSQGEIYQKFYTKYETSGIVRSADLTANQTLTEALQKFDNQQYQAALNLFSQVIANDQNNMVGHFYSGVALQETGKYKNAIKEFETVTIDKDNLFTEQAEWYMGLCFIQTNENKKAYKQFKKIAKKEGFYQQKAKAILRQTKYSED